MKLFQGGRVLLASGENTRARYSRTYINGLKKLVTRQLGFSFCYDATKEDDWKITGADFHAAVTVEKNCLFVERPGKKLELLERVRGTVILAKELYYLIDLGAETVGLPMIEFISTTEQKIRVDWGKIYNTVTCVGKLNTAILVSTILQSEEKIRMRIICFEWGVAIWKYTVNVRLTCIVQG